MSGFCRSYRLDHCSNGGGLLLYIREDIPSRLLIEYKPPEYVECLFVEINIRKKKWLLCCLCNPHGYLCFPAHDPGPRPWPWPRFVFDGPGPNLYLAAPALKLYLPALAN